jgi:hypothetical protein
MLIALFISSYLTFIVIKDSSAFGLGPSISSRETRTFLEICFYAKSGGESILKSRDG